jgi:hypothetical protein
VRAGIPLVADFLTSLFHQGLAIPTLLVYKTAVLQTLRANGSGALPGEEALALLLRSFRLERPRSLRQFPQWDLALVLRSLLRAPYEPMASAELKWVSFKTLFLVMLAAAKRRGEIHALDSRRVEWDLDRTKVTLYPVPDFLPKVLATAEGQERFQPLTISALTCLIGPSRQEPDRLLCPVRALKWYLHRTRHLRGERVRLFLSFQPNRLSDLHPSTLASWVKQVVRHAYQALGSDEASRLRVGTHELRALGASLAVQANFSMTDVLRNCSWAHPTTFTEFYLRDVSNIRGQLHVLGPLVTAGTISQL